MTWIKDSEFIRGKVPMTKFNIRNLVMVNMDLGPGDRFLDIGAGTGSISIQAAKLGCEVVAIEKNPEGIDLIRANGDNFKLDLDIIEGRAPEDLPKKLFNKVFLGGSGGKISHIFDYLEEYLEEGGIFCATFIMPKNFIEFHTNMKARGYKNIEVDMIQVATMDRLGLMKGENPIYIVRGVKL